MGSHFIKKTETVNFEPGLIARIKSDAPQAFRPHEIASVCSITFVASTLTSTTQQQNEKYLNYTQRRKKEGGIDPTLPTDPLNDKNYEDISHPGARNEGHYTLRDKKTGETIEYDKGKPSKPGHRKHDHFHRPNPNRTGKKDKYLDSRGNPVPDKSEPSHLYPPDWVWWGDT